MRDDKQLKIVVQAAGIYCLIYSLFSALTAVARLVAWRFTTNPFVASQTRQIVIEPLLYAVLVLIPAWIFLAKADWFARAIGDMSRPRLHVEPFE